MTTSDPLMEPTSEYTMRHAANLLSNTFGHGTENAANMSAGDLEVIDFAYKQLHRGATTMRAESDRLEGELKDAQRIIAILVQQAGGKAAISRRAIAELPDETFIETTQDVINGGWVIRAKMPDAV